MVVAFLLVITGLQHFDGLIDLGNTFGQRNVQDKKTIAMLGLLLTGEHAGVDSRICRFYRLILDPLIIY